MSVLVTDTLTHEELKEASELLTSCHGCGAQIKFITMGSGRLMPVDPKQKTIITEDGDIVKGYTPHWSTCRQANKFRKRVIRNEAI